MVEIADVIESIIARAADHGGSQRFTRHNLPLLHERQREIVSGLRKRQVRFSLFRDRGGNIGLVVNVPSQRHYGNAP